MGCNVCGKVNGAILVVGGKLFCRGCLAKALSKEEKVSQYPKTLHIVVWNKATCSVRDESKTTVVLKASVVNKKEHQAISDYALTVAERYLDKSKGFDDVGDVINQKVAVVVK